MKTIFVVDDKFYFDDNVECLSYGWTLKEKSKGMISLCKMSMRSNWYYIKYLDLFNISLLDDSIKQLYETWLKYFCSLETINCGWFLSLNNKFINLKEGIELSFRDAALNCINGKALSTSPIEDNHFWKSLRESWKSIPDVSKKESSGNWDFSIELATKRVQERKAKIIASGHCPSCDNPRDTYTPEDFSLLKNANAIFSYEKRDVKCLLCGRIKEHDCIRIKMIK